MLHVIISPDGHLFVQVGANKWRGVMAVLYGTIKIIGHKVIGTYPLTEGLRPLIPGKRFLLFLPDSHLCL